MEKMKTPLVENYGGFDFILNPFEEGTHIFTCLSGKFVCVSPEEGDRFKYCPVLRPASEEEVAYYWTILKLDTIEE